MPTAAQPPSAPTPDTTPDTASDTASDTPRTRRAASARRLALFVPTLAGGGAERVMVNLANAAAARGIAVDLVMVVREGPYLSQVAPQVRVVELQPGGRVLTAIPALASYLRRERPAAMIAALNHANVGAVLARALAGRVPTRVVVTVHNQLSAAGRGAGGESGSVLRALMRRTFPWAHAVVAVSDGVGADVRRVLGLPAERVTTIYNPVVTQAMLRRAEDAPDHPWFAGDGPPVLASVGRLTEQKDFATLLRAFARLRERRACRLLVLGEGSQRAELEGLATDLGLVLGPDGDVDLPGFVENPYAYLGRAAAFVSSSRWEGLPTVHIEALALGTPVVSTDCESGPREILEDGRYGLLVPVGDPAALAAAMAAALEGRTPAFDPVRARRRFTPEASLERYLDVAGFESAPGASEAPNAPHPEQTSDAV